MRSWRSRHRARAASPVLVRARARLALLTLPVGVASCLPAPRFRCEEDDQCVRTRGGATEAGRCERDHVCSFPDPSCPAPGRRYAGLDGGQGLAGRCVPLFCPGDPVTQIALGAAHSCLVRASGAVECWGGNAWGQLGDGTTTPHAAPARVVGLPGGAALVAVGGAHTCARRLQGDVWCWGRNDEGQLGDGALVDRPSPAPTRLSEPIEDLVAGRASTCALSAQGRVWCWGANGEGQLARPAGSAVSGATPQAVAAASGAEGLALSSDHACALMPGGRALCWGGNAFGQAGPGPSVQRVPTFVPELVGAQALALGRFHSCALRATGAVACWGAGGSGQLGGEPAFRARPADVPGLAGVVELVAGGSHGCARRADGAVLCWGAGGAGQLGDGSLASRGEPAVVPGVDDARALAAGDRHTCALRADGTLWCWGDDRDGQLGSGREILRPAVGPAVAALSDVRALAAGAQHTCALDAAGAVACWGAGSAGQLGDGRGMDAATPARPVLPAGAVVALHAGGHASCARTADASVWCWGRDAGQIAGAVPDALAARVEPELSGARALALGETLRCHVPAGTARARCTSRGQAQELSAPDDVVELAAGSAFACARTGAGEIWCWGENRDGQLGAGDLDARAGAVRVPLPAPAAAIVAGDAHACARVLGDGLQCWGRGVEGQLGTGSAASAPAPRPVALDVVAVAAGARHTCLVRRDGGVQCAGSNASGQLGDGGTQGAVSFRVVSGLRARVERPPSGPAPLVAGAAHTCALRTDRTVVCWGAGALGQLGGGGESFARRPRAVLLGCR